MITGHSNNKRWVEVSKEDLEHIAYQIEGKEEECVKWNVKQKDVV